MLEICYNEEEFRLTGKPDRRQALFSMTQTTQLRPFPGELYPTLYRRGNAEKSGLLLFSKGSPSILELTYKIHV